MGNAGGRRDHRPLEGALLDSAERDAELVDASEIGLRRSAVGRNEHAVQNLLLHENHAHAGGDVA